MPTSLVPACQVSLLAGDSGVGKTTLLLQLISASQRGEAFCGFRFPADWTMAIISADRAFASIQDTASRTGADLARIKCRSLVDDESIPLENFERGGFDLLCDTLIPSILPANLLVIDPMIAWLGVSLLDYQRIAGKLVRLSRLAKRHGLTIIGTHHAAAARTDYGYVRAQDRIAGSKGALLGFTSTQMFLDSPETAKKGTACHHWTILSHHAPQQTIYLRRDENGLFLPTSAHQGRLSADDDLAAFLAAQAPLEASTALCVETLAASGHSRATVYRALERLAEQRAIEKTGRGAYRLLSSRPN